MTTRQNPSTKIRIRDKNMIAKLRADNAELRHALETILSDIKHDTEGRFVVDARITKAHADAARRILLAGNRWWEHPRDVIGADERRNGKSHITTSSPKALTGTR